MECHWKQQASDQCINVCMTFYIQKNDLVANHGIEPYQYYYLVEIDLHWEWRKSFFHLFNILTMFY